MNEIIKEDYEIILLLISSNLYITEWM